MNGISNPVAWSKGLLDGVNGFDVELARLSTDGLTLVAQNGRFIIFVYESPSLDFIDLTSSSWTQFPQTRES